MGVSDQLLPTISAIVALGEFSTGDQLADVTDIKTISELLPAAEKQQRAEKEWQGAVAALNQLLSQQVLSQMSPKEQAKATYKKSSKAPKALVISGPVPLLNDLALSASVASQISSWTLVPKSSEPFISSFSTLAPSTLTPKHASEQSLDPSGFTDSSHSSDSSGGSFADDFAAIKRLFKKQPQQPSFHTHLLPLLEDDPLAQERFTLVLTSKFSLVLVLGKDADDELRFQFSFMPEVVNSVWRMLRSRIRVVRPQQLEFIDPLVEKFVPVDPHYRIVSQFNRWMLACLPQPPTHRPTHRLENSAPANRRAVHSAVHSAMHKSGETTLPAGSLSTGLPTGADTLPTAGQVSDSALLQAMAHEIRTPLTTIRTYTRSLLKRQDLDAQVIKRLQSIDRECTQQIDRFSLIFRAVELEAVSQLPKSPLSAIALHQVFQEAIPQWQQAARRRNLSLEVGLPPELPMVASDPTMLQHVLTGLVELFTHSVSPGSHIQLHVIHAGAQLKLQFQSQGDPTQPNAAPQCSPPPLQSLGHLLMFQPETGGLSLNLEATKNLFHALGAKLTVRERSNQGTTWTVFLPLEASGLKSYPIV
jgi:signal transduction histidine kinase